MSTYYRFRSAERLLGREASKDSPRRAGELDELTIYFASPEELNDPLEGHRETYFEGDIIVWRNLIKHYTLLLFSSTINVFSSGGDGAITHVNIRPEDFSEAPREALDKIVKAIFSCQPITTYIESLASTKRKVSRSELSVHFATLHNTILGFVLEEISRHMDVPGASNLKRIPESFLNYIALRSTEIKAEGVNPDPELYQELKSKIKQQMLRANAARTESLSTGLLQISMNFPDAFCRSIDYLIYPHWYVACFMKSCSNSAIWGSYGDNHKGMCLVFKSKEYRGSDCLTLHQLPFSFVKNYNWGRPKDQWHLIMPIQLPLMQVQYKPAYTKPNFFTSLLTEHKDWALSYWYSSEDNEVSSCAAWMNEKPSEILPKYRQQFQQSLSTKTAHWENEVESRIVLSGELLQSEYRTAKFSFSELEGLIFGINTPDDIKVKVIQKIAKHCSEKRRSDFKFYQAKFNDNYSEIKYDLLNYIRFNADGTLDLNPALD